MKRVLVPLAPGFEEIEATTIIDVLRRAGVEVTVAGTTSDPIQGSRGIAIVPDCPLSQVESKQFDMLALPGGGKGVEQLQRHPKLLPLLGEFIAKGKYVSAVMGTSRYNPIAAISFPVNSQSIISVSAFPEPVRASRHRPRRRPADSAPNGPNPDPFKVTREPGDPK